MGSQLNQRLVLGLFAIATAFSPSMSGCRFAADSPRAHRPGRFDGHLVFGNREEADQVAAIRPFGSSHGNIDDRTQYQNAAQPPIVDDSVAASLNTTPVNDMQRSVVQGQARSWQLERVPSKDPTPAVSTATASAPVTPTGPPAPRSTDQSASPASQLATSAMSDGAGSTKSSPSATRIEPGVSIGSTTHNDPTEFANIPRSEPITASESDNFLNSNQPSISKLELDTTREHTELQDSIRSTPVANAGPDFTPSAQTQEMRARRAGIAPRNSDQNNDVASVELPSPQTIAGKIHGSELEPLRDMRNSGRDSYQFAMPPLRPAASSGSTEMTEREFGEILGSLCGDEPTDRDSVQREVANAKSSKSETPETSLETRGPKTFLSNSPGEVRTLRQEPNDDVLLRAVAVAPYRAVNPDQVEMLDEFQYPPAAPARPFDSARFGRQFLDPDVDSQWEFRPLPDCPPVVVAPKNFEPSGNVAEFEFSPLPPSDTPLIVGETPIGARSPITTLEAQTGSAGEPQVIVKLVAPEVDSTPATAARPIQKPSDRR